MLNTVTGTAEQLKPAMAQALSVYRYRIFVDKMGWPLDCPKDHEQDNFDRPDTLYVVAHDEHKQICGCARLLPTHKPYLLGEIFPHLMGGAPLPHSPDVWELSRFAISPPPNERLTAAQAWSNSIMLITKVVETARNQGACRLIAFSAVGNERLLKRAGVNVHRVSVPQLIDDKPVVAFWIEIDHQTTSALGL
ncbi:N-acyl-L-homoserine lactone synthetase [Pseudomonas duriflava]|uniref:Acyl-homoserine-lactone synthase n=1 Tax=Pseudomonas duriflava TaxID=459528 RepID=A0A562QAC9_9PSED|nr:acyl-homoserine-lactone synthase [Pseudomonas duriflava]TWI53698.1 N-acyl-L-homoserine lactone synthetase [Pseudomonas duriflava]